jgi:4'-phosphopantetheinyl transferase
VTTVHLLLHDLDADRTSDAELDALLDSEERARGERFVRLVHRRRFRVGRAMLRRTLASWTGVPTARIAFEYGPNGKPAMRGGPAFNVSHSEGALLIGITEPGRRLGVDVEVMRPIGDRLALAQANFARDEVQALERVPLDEQDEAFLRIWTCKEAFIKALGDGLSIPLRAFCVSPSRAGNALEALDAESLGSDGGCDWNVCGVPLDEADMRAVAAVAIDARDCEVAWLPGLQ